MNCQLPGMDFVDGNVQMRIIRIAMKNADSLMSDKSEF